jgi:ribosomal protein S18 acetylase RimI-like enzyme
MQKIRKAGQSDLEAIGRIEENAFADRRRQSSIALAVSEGLCYLFLAKGKEAGFITIDNLTEKECHIGLIAVIDGYRRNGVASALIEHVIKLYPGRRIFGTTVKLNKAMKEVFLKKGFRQINKKDASELVFEK